MIIQFLPIGSPKT